MVAGVGARLYPLTEDRPKCMIEVGGKSLLRRLLEQLIEVGIGRVILVTGYKADLLMEAARSWDLPLELEEANCPTYAIHNNAVSLGVALGALQGQSFLLCDGDVLVRDGGLFRALLSAPGENVLACTRFEDMGEEEMKVCLNRETGQVALLSKELDPASADGESLGIQKIGATALAGLRRRLAELEEEERRGLYYEDVFAELILEGVPFQIAEIAEGGWTEIDTVEDLEMAEALSRSWTHGAA